MKAIAVRVWHEPAVFIGLLTSIVLAVVTVATGDPWDTTAIVAVIAPLASALGIRQLVSPTVPEPEWMRDGVGEHETPPGAAPKDPFQREIVDEEREPPPKPPPPKKPPGPFREKGGPRAGS